MSTEKYYLFSLLLEEEHFSNFTVWTWSTKPRWLNDKAVTQTWINSEAATRAELGNSHVTKAFRVVPALSDETWFIFLTLIVALYRYRIKQQCSFCEPPKSSTIPANCTFSSRGCLWDCHDSHSELQHPKECLPLPIWMLQKHTGGRGMQELLPFGSH